MNKILNLVNKSIILGLWLFAFYELILHATDMTFSKILTVLCIIPISVVPYLVEKIIKYHMSETFKLLYYAFVTIALILGSILGWYYKISWFDLLAHFLSGVFTSFCALILLKQKKLIKKENTGFIIIFIITTTLSIACFWEFFEFASDKILGGDTQWVFKTGVDDTMTDMLIAFLGSIMFSIYFFCKMKINDSKFIKQLNKVL